MQSLDCSFGVPEPHSSNVTLTLEEKVEQLTRLVAELSLEVDKLKEEKKEERPVVAWSYHLYFFDASKKEDVCAHMFKILDEAIDSLVLPHKAKVTLECFKTPDMHHKCNILRFKCNSSALMKLRILGKQLTSEPQIAELCSTTQPNFVAGSHKLKCLQAPLFEGEL